MELIAIIKAILLGIIEGLTEFIPVSSTAHLILATKLIDFSYIKDDVFEVIIQMGATLAVCVFYHKKIINFVFDFALKNPKQSFFQRIYQNFGFKIFIGFLPAAIFGLFFYKIIKLMFFNPISISLALIIGGLIILFVERLKIEPKYLKIEELSGLQCLKIGLFQVISMIPGVSRSGATIIGGLILKLDRKTAAEFSFFLSIPTIFAASLYDFYKHYNSFDNSKIWLILIGFTFAFLSSLLVIKWFINFISNNSFAIFAYYRIALGLILLIHLILK